MEMKRKGRKVRLTPYQRKKQFNGSAYVSLETIVNKFGSIEAAKEAANKAVSNLFA